jgi:hypothetical protein
MNATERLMIGVGQRIALSLLASSLVAPPAAAAELQARTVAAFDRYVRLTEMRMDGERAFLWLDALPAAQRQARLDELERGELVIERLATRAGNERIEVPGGLVHHWLGLVFVQGAKIDEVLALLQDYDRHASVYRPAVARSRLLARDGDSFRFYARYFMRKIITVVVNSEHEARFARTGPDRAQSRIYSTRIAEVEDPDAPGEREKPVGRDGGYLWRLYTYWRFLQRDGGTYVQCESISLTRGIPLGLRWLVGPFVTSIPRESLEFTLKTTRSEVMRSR